jgi:hypothetical protein
VTLNNYDEIKSTLTDLKLKLKIILDFKTQHHNWTQHKIEKFIINRENNISENQTKMINSILERKPQRLIIDRVLYKDDNNQLIFTDDMNIVEKITIKHYRDIGSHDTSPNNYSNKTPLSPFWSNIYKPKILNTNFTNEIIQPITIDEISSTLRSLPNNKAPGITGITYEMWKHFPSSHHDIITMLFNKIYTQNILPKQWHEALLYPIPKPEFWNCDLNKTRPIILLETLRKLFTKVLNNKLNILILNKNPTT